ncbi:MAG: YwqG family protein [Ktedonobacterales bacterium]
MDAPEVVTALITADLTAQSPALLAIMRNSIRLKTQAVDETTLAVGASKLGGLPDLPSGMAWPQWKGTPMAFIAQITLADAHPYDSEGALPATGLLSFFYDATQQTFGGNPADRGGWSVLYLPDGAALQRQSAPARLPGNARFHACAVTFASEMTAPQEPTTDAPTLQWGNDDQKKYEAFLAALSPATNRAQPHNRLLGHPDTIQDDMRGQCALVTNGINVETDANNPRAAGLLKGALNWRLLLQVDSDPNAGMQWASSGMLYYWIEADALKAAHFDNTWLILQSE